MFEKQSFLLVFILHLYISNGDTTKLYFFEHPNYEGDWISVDTITNGASCFTFPPSWNNRISSLDTYNTCIYVYEQSECRGRLLRIPSHESHLSTQNFDDAISSFELCSPGSGGGGGQPPPSSGGGNDQYPPSSGGGNGQYPPPSGGGGSGQYPPPSGGGSDQYPPSSGGGNNDIAGISLNMHNKFRRRHGSPDLTWDSQIQAAAQRHANYLAKSNKFHQSQNGYGENLAGVPAQTKEEAVRKAIKRWYDEVKNYDYNRPGYQQNAGLFTQVVWKSSRSLGVGVAWNPQQRWWIVIANYNPPGNYAGQFEENVRRPRGTMEYNNNGFIVSYSKNETVLE